MQVGAFSGLRIADRTEKELLMVPVMLLTACLILQETPAAAGDVFEIPADLVVSPVVGIEPGPGLRVRQTTEGWKETSVYHALMLPKDWSVEQSYPVIVEYSGNGGYVNGQDVSQGTPEGCSLGYGISGGAGVIWVCLPCIDVRSGVTQNATGWWGDVAETRLYCLATVREICSRWGGDPSRVVLAGFSRGAIACNFIGLHDAEIATLWCGFVCHSHYDGVRESWPYPGADRRAALDRLRRLNGRPQWISHELSIAETEHYVRGTGISGRFTFVALPWANHTDQWVLRDSPQRRELRRWFAEVTSRSDQP